MSQPNIPDFFAAQQDYIEQLNAMLGVMRASQPIIGEVRMLAHATPPAGWLVCNGMAVSRTDFAALYAAVGVAYGPGDGETTFDLPDFTGRVAVGAPPGETGGSSSIILMPDQIPAHSHGIDSASISVVPGNTAVDPAPGIDPYYLTGVTSSAAGPVTTTAPGATASKLRGIDISIAEAGGGEAIDITPAYTGVLYCIYAGA